MTNIREKIAKIIEKANATDAEGEATVLMAKAQELMEKHSLSMADLVTDDPIGTTFETKVYWNRSGYFHQNLYWALARYFGCRGIAQQVGVNKFEMSVVGRESARVTFELMAPYIAKQVTREASKLVKQDAEQYGDLHELGLRKKLTLSTAKRQVGNALSGRVWRMVHEQESDTKKFANNNPNALVPVDLIKLEEERAFPYASTANSKPKGTTEAARKAAAGISLARQMGGGAAKQIGK